ncbi:RDD family protein [Nocardioides marmoriginsengisoli]|uniref:RDD family protein n=1 Tax=Nocardioides marmoriginsengisoli TaxID=661483 RepID=UPI0016128C17|nr:RDD family protein [Nocardioides marmoriginsengisoli]
MTGPEQQSVLGRLTGAVTGKVLDTIDPDTVLDHIDVNALLDRIDVDRLLDRVDVERLLARVDIDKLLATADVEALVRRSGVPDIVAASTGRFAGSALDLARRQVLVVDVVAGQVLDALLRRKRRIWSHAPPLLRTEEPRVGADGRLDVSGRYAGVVPRAIAVLVDAWAMLTAGTLVLAGIDYLGRTVLDRSITVDASAPGWVAAFVATGFLFVFLCLEVAGRTPGKALLGLRVVSWDGSPLRPGAALARTLMFPVSLGLGGLGCLLAVVQRDRRALHDLVARSAVVHDWTPRAAELPVALSTSLLGASIP